MEIIGKCCNEGNDGEVCNGNIVKEYGIIILSGLDQSVEGVTAICDSCGEDYTGEIYGKGV